MSRIRPLLHRYLTKAGLFWTRLTEPSEEVKSIEARQQARFMASLFIILMFVIPFISMVYYVSKGIAPQDSPGILMVFLAVGILFAGYRMTRNARYRIVCYIVVANSLINPFILINTNPLPHSINNLYFLILPVVLASILFSVRATYFLIVGIQLAIFSVPHWVAGVEYALISEVITINFLIMPLIAYSAQYRNNLEEKRRHELALSEERYRSLFYLAPISIYTKDLEGRYTSSNDPDVSPDEQIQPGMTDREMHPPETAEKLRANDQMVMEAGQKMIFEEPFYRNGIMRLMLSYKVPLQDNKGKVIGLLGVSQDVTERRQAELLLKEQAELLQTIFEHIPVMIELLEADGRFKLVNRAWEKTLGWTLEEVQGHPDILSALYPDKAQHKSVLEFINAAKPVWGDFKVTTRDGRSIETTWANVRLSNGMNIGIGQDITQRKAIERETRKLNSELEEHVHQRTIQLETINKELESFAYSVSHDLRTPLRAIEGFSHAVIEDYGDKLDEQGHEYLERIRRASKRMAILIDSMLTLSRISRSDLYKENIELSALAHSSIEGLRSYDPKRELNIQIQPEVYAYCDRNLMQILLDNLLENAWKFTSKRPDGMIEFGMSEQDGNVVYFVKDNGAGFDMTYKNKLFRAFQRLHIESDYPGTGVGLATVQRIVERHGGQAWAESVVNEGATIYFTIENEAK